MANNKYKEVELLYREADELRKDAHNKWEEARAGKLTVLGVSQDYLMAKTRALMEIAFAIEDYSMWIQGKPLQINPDEVKIYRQLIQLVRKSLP